MCEKFHDIFNIDEIEENGNIWNIPAIYQNDTTTINIDFNTNFTYHTNGFRSP